MVEGRLQDPAQHRGEEAATSGPTWLRASSDGGQQASRRRHGPRQAGPGDRLRLGTARGNGGGQRLRRQSQRLRFYDPTGKAVREAPGIGTLASGTMDMFSPSGRTFVTDCPGGGDGDHCLWDSATGKRVRTFTSACDKVLGWYDESHLYCWEEDNGVQGRGPGGRLQGQARP